MKNTVLFASFFVTSFAFGQHYYNDIADARHLGERMKTYIGQQVKTITATGYDARGARATDFNEWQEINAAEKTWRISTRNGQQIRRQDYRFDEQDRLVSLADSSGEITSTTNYTYNANGRLNSIVTSSRDSLNDFSQSIAHYYHYNADGQLTGLWRVTNGTDSAEYRFTIDEHGNVADEQLYRRGVSLDLIYYYYDDKNRLTDIVRYDKKTKKLLPVSMFEYDDNNRVIQKMSVLSINNPDYIIWRYAFNAQGLKTKEALFNKQKELTGRIDYAYTFSK